MARVIFFSTLFGKKINTESALPLLNLLDILTVNHVYELQMLKFMHGWHKQHLPPIFDNCFEYAKDVHSCNTRYAANDSPYKARWQTNTFCNGNYHLGKTAPLSKTSKQKYI